MDVVRADVPDGVYDTWREIAVLPLGLTPAEEVDMIYQLMRERR